jgi:hypothetical protein
MSHDIGKTKAMMDALLHRGLTPEHVAFLSSGVLMASEQAKSESLNRNYHTTESAASSMVSKDTQPIEPVKIEPWMEVPKNLEFDALDTPNPFVNMSQMEDISLKLQVKADIIREEQEAADAAEHGKRYKEDASYRTAIEGVDKSVFDDIIQENQKNIDASENYDKPEETKSFFGWLSSFFKK